MYYVYILRCTGGALYTGITPHLCRRMQAHCAGKGAKFTRSYPPLALAALWQCRGRTAAARLEYAVKKHLSHAQKEALLLVPERAGELLGDEQDDVPCPIHGVTLEACLEDRFHG